MNFSAILAGRKERMSWKGKVEKYSKGDRHPGRVTIAGFWFIFYLFPSGNDTRFYWIHERNSVFFIATVKNTDTVVCEGTARPTSAVPVFTRSHRTRYTISGITVSDISISYTRKVPGKIPTCKISSTNPVDHFIR